MATEYTESISQLLKDTLPELPGAVRSVALRELRLAMREFFEQSHAWTIRLANVAVPVGDTVVQFDDSDSNTEVIAVHNVLYGDDTEGYRVLTPMVNEPNKVTTASSPWGWYVTSNPDEIKIHPLQDEDRSKLLKADVALMPAFDVDISGTDLPRQITLKYYDAILTGFLARMYMQPNKPYSQPILGSQMRTKFRKLIGYYAAQRKKGYNNTPSWSYPSGGWSPRRRTGVISSG